MRAREVVQVTCPASMRISGQLASPCNKAGHGDTQHWEGTLLSLADSVSSKPVSELCQKTSWNAPEDQHLRLASGFYTHAQLHTHAHARTFLRNDINQPRWGEILMDFLRCDPT